MTTVYHDNFERICAECGAYHIFVIAPPGERETGPYCRYWKKFFPDSGGWLTGRASKPGERSCSHWKARGRDEWRQAGNPMERLKESVNGR